MTILIALRYKDQTVLGTDGMIIWDNMRYKMDDDKWTKTRGGLWVGIAGQTSVQDTACRDLDQVQDPLQFAAQLNDLARRQEWNAENGDNPIPWHNVDGIIVDQRGDIWALSGDGWSERVEPVHDLYMAFDGSGSHIAHGAVLSQLLWLSELEDDLAEVCMNALRCAVALSDNCDGTLRVHVLKPGSNILDHTLIYETERHGLANVTLRREDPE